ncbi:MAG: hypothetical protein ACYCYE_00980 [Clostridia bacterium]
MKFRECRITTLHEIFKHAEVDVSLPEIFLILGGLKVALYFIQHKSVKFFVPAGFSDISCPYIFEKFHISYEAMGISDFLSLYKKDTSIMEKYIFVLPFSSEILNIREMSNIDFTLFGQSYMPIKSVDFEQEKVMLKSVENDEGEYWIDLDNFGKLEMTSSWLLEDNLKVYTINKERLKFNSRIKEYSNENRIIQLRKVAEDFLTDNYVEFEDGVIRMEGRQVYDYIHRQFLRIRTEFMSTSDSKKLNLITKYLRFQFRYFRQFILAGTDAYYRNEFAEVISYVFKDYVSTEVEKNINEWDEIAKLWRQVGRDLLRAYSYNTDIPMTCSIIDVLLSTSNSIRLKEINAINNLLELCRSLPGIEGQAVSL